MCAVMGRRRAVVIAIVFAWAVHAAWAGSPAPELVYEHAAVASDHVVASNAGVEMLRRGGNAVRSTLLSSTAGSSAEGRAGDCRFG